LRDLLADEHLASRIQRLLDARVEVGQQLFEASAERLALLCHAMAERFARGGRLLAFASQAAACSDARHVAVEFVHPVIVGKRALPALALTGEPRSLALRAGLHLRAEDIALGFGARPGGTDVAAALAGARRAGALTVAFDTVGAEWEFVPATEDPYVHQEVVESVGELMALRLGSPRANSIAIVDTTSVTDRAHLIEDDNLGSSCRAESRG